MRITPVAIALAVAACPSPHVPTPPERYWCTTGMCKFTQVECEAARVEVMATIRDLTGDGISLDPCTPTSSMACFDRPSSVVCDHTIAECERRRAALLRLARSNRIESDVVPVSACRAHP